MHVLDLSTAHFAGNVEGPRQLGPRQLRLSCSQRHFHQISTYASVDPQRLQHDPFNLRRLISPQLCKPLADSRHLAELREFDRPNLRGIDLGIAADDAEVPVQKSRVKEGGEAEHLIGSQLPIRMIDVVKVIFQRDVSSTFAVFWGFPKVSLLGEMVGIGQVPHLAQGGYHAHYNRPSPQAVVPETTPEPVPCISTPTGPKSSCGPAADRSDSRPTAQTGPCCL